MPIISVIIPTLNAANYIKDLLDGLLAQTYIPDEILLVDSSSEDDTLKIASQYPVKTITIPRDEFDHGGTRNLGVRHTNGDVIVFLTQDAVPADKYLIEKLIAPLESPLIAASHGRHIPKEEANPIERFSRAFNYPEIPLLKDKFSLDKIGIKAFFFSDVCSAIRRKEFNIMGGFPERIISNEDMNIAARLILNGFAIAYIPEARVYHSHNYNLIDLFKRYFDIGVSFAQNNWLLKYANPKNEGKKYIKELTRFLIKKKAYSYIPLMILESISKYAGYRLGLIHDYLPFFIKKRLSMNYMFFSNMNTKSCPLTNSAFQQSIRKGDHLC